MARIDDSKQVRNGGDAFEGILQVLADSCGQRERSRLLSHGRSRVDEAPPFAGGAGCQLPQRGGDRYSRLHGVVFPVLHPTFQVAGKGHTKTVSRDGHRSLCSA